MHMVKTAFLAGAALLALAPLAVTTTASAAPAAPARSAPGTPSAAHHAASKGVAPAATYNNGCGAGYGVIDSLPIGTLGTVFLTYNSSTHDNCVVTVRNSAGAATNVVAGMKLSGTSTWHYDQGNYTTYAGPVYLAAAGKCVDWYGIIGSTTNVEYNSHCG